ncbi:MAG: imidazole glycerol phosphate synthase subunit HisH [Planctomycetes bacterium]|nr:imidazole glycerol phosphate synthase subunit HisH [Planctomycetota bacterium]
MIGIVDYGMGNLRSVQKALQRVGADATIIRQPDQIAACDKLILPGVGAFKDAIAHLVDRNYVESLRNFVATGRPFLGICLGLQLLFDTSEEDGVHAGLGFIPGKVIRFNPTEHALKVPHMGWNTLDWTGGDNPLLAGLAPGASVYFVHSYFAVPADAADIATTTDYAGRFCSAARRDNVFATQFHPEKSQHVGLKMLSNFASL